MRNNRQTDRVLGILRIPVHARYALEGVRVLARAHGGGPMGAEAMAKETGVPAEFLAKILTRLAAGRLLTSRRGPGGGFALARRPDRITVAEVLRALPGPEGEDRPCLLGHHACDSRHPCAMHDTAVEAEAAITRRLEALTLADLAAEGAV